MGQLGIGPEKLDRGIGKGGGIVGLGVYWDFWELDALGSSTDTWVIDSGKWILWRYARVLINIEVAFVCRCMRVEGYKRVSTEIRLFNQLDELFTFQLS